MVKTKISSKGQTTIPVKFRARWNTSEVAWEGLPDGRVAVWPIPDIMSLFGSAQNSQQPYDTAEKQKAREAWAESTDKTT